MSIRKQKVAEEIRKVISERLIRGLKTPLPGFVTISSVEVSSDLSIAKVYFSVFGSPSEQKEAALVLNQEKKAIRAEVAKKVKLRLVPELTFIKDETVEKAAHLNALLAKVTNQDTEE